MMWYITSAFLYVEMAAVVLMMVPILSSRSWAKLFKSRLFTSVATFSTYYFNFFMFLLVLALIEALRHMMNHRNSYNALKEHPSDVKPETESLYLMRLFRAQRNVYISGFALFTLFVLRRLMSLISDHARLSASEEASLKQALSASQVASQLMQSRDSQEANDRGNASNELEEKLKKMTTKLSEEKTAHKATLLDLETVKKQAKQVEAEYDRVASECQDLQRQLLKLKGDSSNKKAD